MTAKLRQLGWMCVAPTPDTHAWAEAGRSDRRAVEPRKTIRIVAVDWLACIGALSSHATDIVLAITAMMRRSARTQLEYLASQPDVAAILTCGMAATRVADMALA
jgi:hypothetical protein